MRRWATFSALVLLAVIWGSQYLVIRATQAELPPWRAVALRFSVVALLGQLAMVVGRARAPGGKAPLRVAMGATQALSMGLLYAGQARLPSALASVLMATTPLFVAVLARRWLRERVPLASLGAGALGVAGIALMSGGVGADGALGAGVAAVIAAAAASAASKTIGKALTALPIPVLLRDLGAVVALLALVASLVTERAAPWSLSARAALGALYLGAIASCAANAVYFEVLRHIEVSRIAYLGVVSAALGLLAGVVVAGEAFDGWMLGGAVVVLAGVALHAAALDPATLTAPVAAGDRGSLRP